MQPIDEVVLAVKTIDDSVIVEASGNVNSNNSKQFSEQMTHIIAEGCSHVVIDLSGLSFMTSAGFRALLIAGRTASNTNSRFSICGMNAKVHQLFELGGFLDVFPIYDSVENALAAVD